MVPYEPATTNSSGYLLLRARYGLRIIYHIITGLGPKKYQLVIRLGRISHKQGWNDFPVLLEVKSVQTGVNVIHCSINREIYLL